MNNDEVRLKITKLVVHPFWDVYDTEITSGFIRDDIYVFLRVPLGNIIQRQVSSILKVALTDQINNQYE